MIAKTSISQPGWTQQYESICNAPVAEISREELGNNHPADLFFDEFQVLRQEYGGTPHRNLLSPARFKDYLRWLFIFEREDFGSDVRFIVRLEGTSVVELTHHDYTGRFLDEFTNNKCYNSRHIVLDFVTTAQEPRYARIMVSDHKTAEYKTDVTVGFYPFIAGKDKDRQQVVALVAPYNEELRALL